MRPENGYLPPDISTATNNECYNMQVMSPEQQQQQQTTLNMEQHPQYSTYSSHQVSPYYGSSTPVQVNGTSAGYSASINAAGEAGKELSAPGLAIYSTSDEANNEPSEVGVHPTSSSMHLTEPSGGTIHSLTETPSMIEEANMLAANEAAQQVATPHVMQLTPDLHYRHPGAGQTSSTEYGSSMVQMDACKPQYVTPTHHIDQQSLMDHYHNQQRHHLNDYAHGQITSGLLAPSAYPYDKPYVRAANEFPQNVVGCDYPSAVTGNRGNLNSYKSDLWMGKNKLDKKQNDREYTPL